MLPASSVTFVPPHIETNITNRLHDFSCEADSLIRNDTGGGFRACGALLESLCIDGTFIALLNHELERLLNDPDYVLQASTGADMLVCKSNEFTLLLKLAMEPQRKDRLFAQTFDTILSPLGKRSVKLSRYRQLTPQPNDIFDRSKLLTFVNTEEIVQGASSFFGAGEDVCLITNDTEDQPPLLLACLVSANKLLLRWEYDALTLTPMRAVASDSSATRLQFLAQTMSAMENEGAVPALEGLLDHPAHFVRWTALQAIFRLNHSRGIHLLRRSLADPHEHIRNAARKSLHQLGI